MATPNTRFPGATDHSAGLTLGRFVAKVTHADLDAAATSDTVALTDITTGAGFPANAIPLAAHVELDTEFSGGAVSAITVAVGDAADADELFTATSVFTGATAGMKSAAGAAVGKFAHESAYSPILTAALTGGNAADLTAGSLYVIIQYVINPPITA